MLSMGGIGAPGAAAFRVKEGVQEVPVRVLPELGNASKSVSPGASGIFPSIGSMLLPMEESVNGVIKTPTTPAEYAAASSAMSIRPRLIRILRGPLIDSLISCCHMAVKGRNIYCYEY